MGKTLRGDLLLLLIAFFWGISYYLSDLCLTELGPFTLNAWRFLCAFAIAFLLLFKKIGLPNRKTLKYAALLGVILAAVYALANFCLLHTSLSNAGFLCSLATVTTPILALLFQRKRPGIKLGIVILMSVAGVALLSLTEEFTIRPGDIFGVICSLFAGGHILVTERAVTEKDVEPVGVGVWNLLFTGVIMFAFSAVLEHPAGGVIGVPHSPGVWLSLAFLTIFCTALSFVLQPVAQQWTEASRVGVIYTLEPVFAGLVAFVIAGDVLLPRAYVGAALMIISMLVMEIDFGRWREKKLRR
jgi:drug/metabolite transporter (DMT)-like permease